MKNIIIFLLSLFICGAVAGTAMAAYPHHAAAEKCARCSGTGLCRACNGKGKSLCASCKGQKGQTDTIELIDPVTNAASVKVVKNGCEACSKTGYVTCTSCKGGGKCAACKGHGKG